jgi:hypothetical protein
MRAPPSPGATFYGSRRPVKRCTWVVGVLLALVLVGSAQAAPQPPEELRVDGGEESWHPGRQFAVRWTNPPQPVSAVRYRVLDPDGGVAVPERTLDWAATSIPQVSVLPVPGTYTIEVRLVDGSGAAGAPATAKLRFDDAPPADVAPIQPGQWIGRTAFPYALLITHPQGPEPLSGIRGYAVAIGSAPGADPCAGEVCGEGEVDLPEGSGDDTFDIGALPEGPAYVSAVAVSGSGVPSALPGEAVLRVDETDPQVNLEGMPGGWARAPVTLTASASDAGAGMAPNGGPAPYTAIRVDGGTATVTTGDAVTTTVISSGVHLVAYYARDAAGNVADGGSANGIANRPPTTATVRIDREPPELAFAAGQDPSDPELIEAGGADRLSGLDPTRGSIAVRRVGSGDRFAALQTEVVDGRLRARWSSGALAPGEYEFRATAYDLAGNAASTASRAGGAPMRLRAPLEVPVRLLAQTGRRVLRYGRATWFGGRAIAARRTPLAGVAVRIDERFEAGGVPAERTTTVRADEQGRFGVHLEPGPSREVVASVEPTRTLRGANSEPLQIAVQGHVGLRTSAPVAHVGGRPLVFTGRVADSGAPIPADGKVVQLQFRLPGMPWREFRTVRTNSVGRFRYAYRFADDDSRGARFQFRAVAPTQANWPYEPTSSRPTTVRGI